jgi:pimeloyl-ACP methyl ester carboxylesterase
MPKASRETASERATTEGLEAEARERVLAGLPVSHRRLDAAGVSTALLEGGAGSPLVLLHGGIECGGAYWAPVITRLVENHCVIGPDAPGLGGSEPIAGLDDETFAPLVWGVDSPDLRSEAGAGGAFALRNPGRTLRRGAR